VEEILSAHVTHKWVDTKRLSLYTAREAGSLLSAASSLDSVKECALLKTCNRVEVYLTTDDPEGTKATLGALLVGSVKDATPDHVRFLSCMDSVKHLANVASGLDSMIVGESQVLTQVKDAYAFALKEGTIGKTLGEVFRKAISIGKKVRSETGINRGAVSIGSAAVGLAQRLLGSLEGRTILVIGAGKISQLVGKALARQGLKAIFVANRTYDSAVGLAGELGGEAVHFDRLPGCLWKSDVVICGTSAPHTILGKKDLVAAFGPGGPQRPLIIIDISNPRNVAEDIQELPNVKVHDMDGLRKITEKNTAYRKREVKRAERIIEKELHLMDHRLKEKGGSEEAIRRLHTRATEIREEEFAKAIKKLGPLSDGQKKVVHDLLLVVTKKVLEPPTHALKQASKSGDKELLEAAEKLFRTRKV
jgi:glutamyl-tRNA reductase